MKQWIKSQSLGSLIAHTATLALFIWCIVIPAVTILYTIITHTTREVEVQTRLRDLPVHGASGEDLKMLQMAAKDARLILEKATLLEVDYVTHYHLRKSRHDLGRTVFFQYKVVDQQAVEELKKALAEDADLLASGKLNRPKYPEWWPTSDRPQWYVRLSSPAPPFIWVLANADSLPECYREVNLR